MAQDMEHALTNGRGWYQNIVELLEKLDHAADGSFRDDVQREIEEGPLSIMVRDGWRSPTAGALGEHAGADEYEILLSTGGPALRIYGQIGEYNEPKTAELQAQDWFTPWVRVPDCEEEKLLAYARCFWFGED